MRGWAWLALAALATGCAQPPAMARVAWTFHHLVPLPPAHGSYEAWAIAAGKPHSLGKFAVRDNAPTDAAGNPWSPAPLPLAPAAIEAVALTQEPPDDTDPAPAPQRFLAGPVVDGRAALAPPLDPAVIAAATGVYLLDNPVTYKDPDDANGIWFARYVMKRYEPGLTLPDAPDGWLWAGWVVLDGRALRTGKFRGPADNDDWAGYSGRSGETELINPAGKPMPGEDFIANLPAGVPTGRNRPQLGGAEVVVSLEPANLANEDVYPGPLRVFAATVPTPGVHMRRYTLANVVAAHMPTATAVIMGGGP